MHRIHIISAIAFVILLSVQVYILSSLWRSHDDNLKLQYHTLATDAINELSHVDEGGVFDQSFTLVDKLALETIIKLARVNTHADSVSIQEAFVNRVTKHIQSKQKLSATVQDYFDKKELDSEFTDSLLVKNLVLIGTTSKEIPLIEHSQYTKDKGIIPISSFINETPYYKMSLEYSMNVMNRRGQLLEEIAFVLLLSIFSFGVMCYLFVFTYRHLVKERLLSEMKTDFINNMTHELKTPLSTITVLSRALELEPIRKDEKRVLEKALQIKKQNDHLSGIINKLLDVAMWERNDFTLEQESMVVDNFVDKLVEEFRSGCDEAIKFHVNLEAGDCRWMIDKVYFAIAINNILSNAVKYSSGNSELMITAKVVNKELLITLSDNGIGINAADIPFVFDKFYRVRQGNVHNVKGLGLGLFYTQKIITAHGGRISVTSELGKGSCFVLCFPMV